MEEKRKVYKVLGGKPKGKRPLGRPTCRWEDVIRPRRRWENGIRVDLRETGWGSIEWIQLAQDRGRWRSLVNTVMNLSLLVPRC
jgi:hypothetical protein